MTDHKNEFSQEQERLAFTQAYMDQLIAAQHSGQEELKKRQEDTLARLDFKDSSLRYQEMLSHANFMKMSKDQLESLTHLRNKPYFARIDFHRKEKPDRETFYIGKTSLFDRETQLPIILDWRSPLSNVYYEGRLGDVSYVAHGETYEGNVSLKRQYEMDEGRLIDFRDIDMTTKDDLLQDSLAKNSDNRLTEIVATIQEEQNRIIRADLRKPIIVQGAAGSGKTTIALHRISYFLYTMREVFKPEEMLILAPNRLFIHYIEEVLPELGVQRSRQSTYQDFVKQVVGLTWPVVSQHQVLMEAVEQTGKNKPLQAAEYKGSKEFKNVLDRYLKHIKKTYRVTEGLTLAGFKIKSPKAINRLFYEEYSYFPYQTRVKKIKEVLRSELRRKKKEILTKMASKYDEELDKALYGMRDPDKRKKRVSFLITRKEERLEEIKKEARYAVQRCMKQYPKHQAADLYRELFDDQLFAGLTAENRDDLREVQAESIEQFKKKRWSAEDLAAILYLHSFVTGLDRDDQAKKVVIDEAQDYSFLEIYSLRRALHTDLFTIVGDLAQGIYQYRGLKNWEVLIDDIFHQAQYLTLQKTYRTTIEIMDLANEQLQKMPENLPEAEPVVRHGEKPMFVPIQVWEDRREEMITHLQAAGMKTMAIVTKTSQEAEQLDAALPVELGFVKMDEHQEMGERMIVPAYLAKGLEFDVVFLYTDEHPYTLNELDVKLLYVAMTRPLHKLYMIGSRPEDFLLEETSSSWFEKQKDTGKEK
ncbi:AAA family ATPase [Halobacillus litoralis]|uniref:RNA polymerase recycling motor HelD n=1 Tax=Halobacillus litoralis TaxID=45668 RepID=UPI001CD3E28D|nr:RNA polymerase recycling motor HelD [Halobacillus litoralis]MCA0969750.1 AAA family ATPase [Halobacillus litoralis]